ncbi:MAG: hypothetical protein IPK33_14010 [Gemmatimonadetes bacterium]|nr:hypothetical protein [Gemmatimonadota bacterium]
MKKRWAKGPLLASLLGLIGQDIALFGMSPVAIPASAYALQGAVLVIAVLLLLLANRAARGDGYPDRRAVPDLRLTAETHATIDSIVLGRPKAARHAVVCKRSRGRTGSDDPGVRAGPGAA